MSPAPLRFVSLLLLSAVALTAPRSLSGAPPVFAQEKSDLAPDPAPAGGGGPPPQGAALCRDARPRAEKPGQPPSRRRVRLIVRNRGPARPRAFLGAPGLQRQRPLSARHARRVF